MFWNLSLSVAAINAINVRQGCYFINTDTY